MRLIDADALIPDRDYYEGGGYDAVSCEQIDKAPTVKRPQGEWIKEEDTGLIGCSCCHIVWLRGKTAFCPNCGADMREEDSI